MYKNVGGIDRGARIIVGGALLVAGLLNYVPYGTIVAVAGAVFLVTGTISYCPIEHAIGINTRKEKS